MVAWLAILFAIAFCPSAYAIAFPAPLPTVTQSITSEPPQPTQGVQLKRRYEYLTSDFLNDGTYTRDYAGGWFSSKLTTDENWSYFGCSSSSSCVFHKSNAAFTAGMQGCCSDHACDFATTCYERSSLDATPSLTDTDDPWAIFCTDIDKSECATYDWEGTYVNMRCTKRAFSQTIYTKALYWDDNDDSITLTQKITTISDSFLADISSTKMSSWSAGLGPTSSSTESVPTSTPSQSPTTTSSPKDSNTSKSSGAGAGAIAGGVVGGVVGGAAITGAAIFLFLRRKKKTRQEPSDEANDIDYQAIPQSQSHNPSWLMQPVTEPEAAYKPEGTEPKPYTQDPPAELPDRAHR